MDEPHANGQAAALHAASCLRMDPYWQAGEVLEARRAWLGLRSDAVDAAAETDRFADRRGKAQRRLKQLRADAWDADPAKQLERIALVDAEILDENPDLRELADRLVEVASARAATPDLREQRGYDADFFNAFRVVVTGTPQQAAETRQRLVAAFRDKALRNRGVRAIRLMRTRGPRLYALEQSFLDGLLKKRGAAGLSRQPSPETSQSEQVPIPGQESGTRISWVWYALGFFILSNLARALIMLQGD